MLKISHKGNADQYYHTTLHTLLMIASIKKIDGNIKNTSYWSGLEHLHTAGEDGTSTLFSRPSKIKQGVTKLSNLTSRHILQVIQNTSTQSL